RYRGQSLPAETFYRHAVELVPSNGQPYNQLALLEAASGEKLSTVYFYVRSLCVQHPFPLAATNLQNLFMKMSSDRSGSEGKTRMSAFEYVSVFLQFHSMIHLNNLKKQPESLLSQLSTSLPALIIAEKFETWQLVQMAAVCLFAVEHARGTLDTDQSSGVFDESALAPEEIKAAALVEELLASMLHALLLPVHASLEPKETANYYTLPAIKAILDWLLQEPQRHKAFHKNPQVWHGLCKLLNDLDVVTKEPFDLKKLEDIPLPEDWDLQSFLPLKKSQRRLKFSLKTAVPSDEESIWLRSVRLCKLGESLASVDLESCSKLLSMSETEGKRVFKAVLHTESLSEEVLQQIQELTTSSDIPNGNTPVSDAGSMSLRSKARDEQEVRFKLDDAQQRKEESAEKPERRTKESSSARRTGRQNVAMQAILQQQRASQIPSQGRGQESGLENNKKLLPDARQASRPQNMLDNAHHLRTSNENCMTPPNELNMNSTGHHISPEQYNHFQQAQTMSGVQQCDRNEAWTQQFNLQQTGVPSMPQLQRDTNPISTYLPRMTRPPPSFNMRQPPPPQQQPPAQHVIAPNPAAFIAGTAPNVLWNYMGFVAPAAAYQQGQPGAVLVQQQQPQQVAQIAPQAAQRAPQGFYVVNGGAQQQEREQLGAIAAAYQQQQQQQVSSSVLSEQVKEHLANQALLWQQQQQENGASHLLNQVVGRGGVTQGGGNQVAPDMSPNTYSLFNSPWPPSGMHAPLPRTNKDSQHNNIDPVFMQSRIQSLWSGPGPSPLERLLEQQKQRRDGSNQ
ncbi:hypothetical protein JTE90_006076, partial [Oedothorax gibbosus]